MRNPLGMKHCRERSMCRSALIERYLLTYMQRFIPPHQSLTRQLPPKVKPSVGSANCIKSASNFNNSYFQRSTYFTGAQSEGSAPHSNPLFRFSTNLNHFYPVAGERRKPPKSRLTGFCSGAAGIRSTANGYTRVCTIKREI